MHKQELLKNLVWDHKPYILLIQEMKMQIDNLESLKNLFFKDYGLHGVSSEGASGGISNFWNARLIKGFLIVEGFNHVETKFFLIRDSYAWVISNVYSPNLKRARKKLWDDFGCLQLNFLDSPWLVVGDFNIPLCDMRKWVVCKPI